MGGLAIEAQKAVGLLEESVSISSKTFEFCYPSTAGHKEQLQEYPFFGMLGSASVWLKMNEKNEIVGTMSDAVCIKNHTKYPRSQTPIVENA